MSDFNAKEICESALNKRMEEISGAAFIIDQDRELLALGKHLIELEKAVSFN